LPFDEEKSKQCYESLPKIIYDLKKDIQLAEKFSNIVKLVYSEKTQVHKNGETELDENGNPIIGYEKPLDTITDKPISDSRINEIWNPHETEMMIFVTKYSE